MILHSTYCRNDNDNDGLDLYIVGLFTMVLKALHSVRGETPVVYTVMIVHNKGHCNGYKQKLVHNS